MPQAKPSTDKPPIEVVVFDIGDEKFGLEIGSVREVVKLPEVTPVPSMPSWLVGVVNLRGEIIPVVSLTSALGAAPHDITSARLRLVVSEIGDKPVGILVEGMPQISRIDPSLIDSAPEIISTRLKKDFVRGVIKDHSGLIILLNLNAVVKMDDLALPS